MCGQKRGTRNRIKLAKGRARPPEAVVHKLFHMKVLNHGKLFKALLRAHLNRAKIH